MLFSLLWLVYVPYQKGSLSHIRLYIIYTRFQRFPSFCKHVEWRRKLECFSTCVFKEKRESLYRLFHIKRIIWPCTCYLYGVIWQKFSLSVGPTSNLGRHQILPFSVYFIFQKPVYFRIITRYNISKNLLTCRFNSLFGS